MDETKAARREKRESKATGARKEKKEAKASSERGRSQYITVRLNELKTERSKLLEERKALKSARRAKKGKGGEAQEEA